MQSTADE